MKNTQKYFKKEKEKIKTESNNLSETLKMVWKSRPPRYTNQASHT